MAQEKTFMAKCQRGGVLGELRKKGEGTQQDIRGGGKQLKKGIWASVCPQTERSRSKRVGGKRHVRRKKSREGTEGVSEHFKKKRPRLRSIGRHTEQVKKHQGGGQQYRNR